MRFDENESDEFNEARDVLMARYRNWAGLPAEGGYDPGLLLDWKWGYADGQLDRWAAHDLDEFLLDWCPRKVSMPPSQGPELLRVVRGFLAFLAAEGLLADESDPPAALDAALAAGEATFVAALGDASRFGMAKSIVTSMGGLPDDHGPESVAAMMEAFNALSFDERGRILGIPDEPQDPWRQMTAGIELPPARAKPSPEATAAASEHALARDVDTIAAFVGTGRRVTAKGNLTVADALALAAKLGLDRESAEASPGYKVRSADDVPGLQVRMRVARLAGATKVAKGAISATATWRKLDRIAALRKLVSAVLAKGLLQVDAGERAWAPWAVYQMLDEGVPHLLAVLWAVDGPIEFDDLSDSVVEVCEPQLRWGPSVTPDRARRQIESSFAALVELLEWLGVAARDGDEREAGAPCVVRRHGGAVRVTALGRAVLADHLRANGYRVEVAGALAAGELREVLARVGEWGVPVVEAEFDAWVEAHSSAEAADALAVWAADAAEPLTRVAAMSLAGRLDEPGATRAARLMLDTPVRGHAMTWLIEQDGSDAVVERTWMLHAGIDVLALLLRDGIDGEIAETIAHIDDPVGFCDEVWRLDHPQAGDVLAAFGRLHPDAAVAKHARKSLLRHRSHMANRR